MARNGAQGATAIPNLPHTRRIHDAQTGKRCADWALVRGRELVVSHGPVHKRPKPRRRHPAGHGRPVRPGHGAWTRQPHVRAERPSAGDGRNPRSRSCARRYHTPAHESRKSRRSRRLRSATAFTYAHPAPAAPQRGPLTRVAPPQTAQTRPPSSAPRIRALPLRSLRKRCVRSCPSAPESPPLAREMGKGAQGCLADVLVDEVESCDVGL